MIYQATLVDKDTGVQLDLGKYTKLTEPEARKACLNKYKSIFKKMECAKWELDIKEIGKG